MFRMPIGLGSLSDKPGRVKAKRRISGAERHIAVGRDGLSDNTILLYAESAEKTCDDILARHKPVRRSYIIEGSFPHVSCV
jgi:hypothetical protein